MLIKLPNLSSWLHKRWHVHRSIACIKANLNATHTTEGTVEQSWCTCGVLMVMQSQPCSPGAVTLPASPWRHSGVEGSPPGLQGVQDLKRQLASAQSVPPPHPKPAPK